MSSKTNNDPEGHLPLSPAVFHILLALADEERHGYGIMQEVKRRTDGKVRLGAGTLYGAIKRLLEKGIIAERGERPDPGLNEERRRYYRLTDFGQRVLRVDVSRLNQLVQQARAKEVLLEIASLLVMESM
jgi:DNA-binding PadR family transcriptional regulator